MKIVCLQVSTWVGLSIGAEHYYGTLVCRRPEDGKRIEYRLTRQITSFEALEMNRKDREADDGFSQRAWKPGDETSGFPTRDAVRERAREVYRQHFPEDAVLLEGWIGDYDPRLVLDGPDELVREGNAIVDEAEANNWWEGDEQTMKAISRRWQALLERFSAER